MENIQQQTRSERRADPDKTDEQYHVTHHPPSHWRRLYKRSLARQSQIEEKDNAERGPRYSDEASASYRVIDCVRCTMQLRGFIMISDSVLCTCKVRVPDVQIIITEDDVEDKHEHQDTVPYVDVLATSVTLSSTKIEAPITKDNPPSRRIKLRTVDQHQYEEYTTVHHCENALLAYNYNNETLELRNYNEHSLNRLPKPGDKLKRLTIETEHLEIAGVGQTATSEHVLIYAPPGCGKTTLQSQLHHDAIQILDTDDMPTCTQNDVKHLLRWTSVLTNRIDLISSDYPCIMFTPKDIQSLERSLSGQLTQIDIQYWYEAHQKITIKRE